LPYNNTYVIVLYTGMNPREAPEALNISTLPVTDPTGPVAVWELPTLKGLATTTPWELRLFTYV
jgi:hypothetical protein